MLEIHRAGIVFYCPIKANRTVSEVRVAGVSVLETSCLSVFFDGVRGEAGVAGCVHAAGASESFNQVRCVSPELFASASR